MKKVLFLLLLFAGSFTCHAQISIYSIPETEYKVMKINRFCNLYEIYLLGYDVQIYKVVSDRNCKTRLKKRKYKEIVVGEKLELTLISKYPRFGENKMSLLLDGDFIKSSREDKCEVNIERWCVWDLFESPEIKDRYYIGD